MQGSVRAAGGGAVEVPRPSSASAEGGGRIQFFEKRSVFQKDGWMLLVLWASEALRAHGQGGLYHDAVCGVDAFPSLSSLACLFFVVACSHWRSAVVANLFFSLGQSQLPRGFRRFSEPVWGEFSSVRLCQKMIECHLGLGRGEWGAPSLKLQ